MEQYVHSLKNQVADEEKLGGKLDDEEKETINDGIESTIEWLDESGEVIYIPLWYNSERLLRIGRGCLSKLYQRASIVRVFKNLKKYLDCRS